MKTKNIFPYPIIGDHSDFKDFSFSGSVISYCKIENDFHFEVNFNLIEPTLINLIKEKKVALIAIVSNNSFYRETFKHFRPEENLKILIPSKLIRGNFSFNFNFKICANQFFEYQNLNAVPIFHDYNFKMEPGQILGIAENSEKVILQKGFASFKNSNSFLKIKRGLEDATITLLKIDKDTVHVYLTPKNYELYLSAQKLKSVSLLSILVMPIIIELIYKIKASKEEYTEENYSWVEVLMDKFESNVSFDDEESALTIAENILNFPIYNSLREINSLLEIANQEK